jgi:hypothetical protein
MAATTLTDRAVAIVAQLGGFAVLAATLAALAAAVYRWYVSESVPGRLSLLVGLAGVSLYLNTTDALSQVIAGSITETEVALFNIGAYAVGAAGAAVGRRAGDRFATDVVDRVGETEGDVGRLVQTVGRVVSVDLPEDVADTPGYDPVPPETKDALAGRTLLFPKRLTVAELERRLAARLTTDYAVGHVDVELAADGSVEHLAVGARPAGIGPTLPPATNAVAVRADPALAASAGDVVQVWEPDPTRRVVTAELRGVSGDVATLAIDAADTQKLDPRTEYRLVTLPVEDRPDREFADLLRAADETFASVTVAAGSPLHGLPAGALDVTVVAVRPEGAEPEPLPPRDRLFAPGDSLFVIATAGALRRLETAAEPLEPGVVGSPPDADEPAAPTRTGSEPDPAGADDDAEPATPETGVVSGQADASTFDELKAEMTDEDDDREVAFEGTTGPADADAPETDRDDEADTTTPSARSLAEIEADLEAETDPAEGANGEESGDGAAADPDGTGEPETDDLDALDFADEDEEFGEDDVFGDDSAFEAGDGDESDDGDDGDGGSTFAELKAEFESGEADWEDEVSDSPGGDMRLDPDE